MYYGNLNYADWEETLNGIAGAGQTAGGLLPPLHQGDNPHFLKLHYGTATDGPGAPYEIRVDEWWTMQQALTSARNFYYSGHAGAIGLGADRVLNTSDIAKMLCTKDPVARHPYRFVFIDGCEGMLPDIKNAFGGLSGSMVQDYNPYDWKDNNTRPYAFVGFQKVIQWWQGPQLQQLSRQRNDALEGHPLEDKGTIAGSYDYGSPPSRKIQPEFILYRSEFINKWTGTLGIVHGKPLVQALREAYQATTGSGIPIAFDNANGLVIYGYPPLEWKQCNSPDWKKDLP